MMRVMTYPALQCSLQIHQLTRLMFSPSHGVLVRSGGCCHLGNSQLLEIFTLHDTATYAEASYAMPGRVHRLAGLCTGSKH